MQNTSTITLSVTQPSVAVFSRDENGSGLKPILAKSGLDRIAIFLKIGRSELDRTEKIFVVLM